MKRIFLSPSEISNREFQGLAEGKFSNMLGDENGFGEDGFDENGFDENGFGEDGYDESGFNENGFHREDNFEDGYGEDNYVINPENGAVIGKVSDFSPDWLRNAYKNGARFRRNKKRKTRRASPQVVQPQRSMQPYGVGSNTSLSNLKMESQKIQITIANTANGAGNLAVDLLVNTDALSGGVPIFGAAANVGNLVSTTNSDPQPFQNITGATALSTCRKPTLQAIPVSYSQVLNQSSANPFRVKGLKIQFSGTDDVIARQKLQPMLIKTTDMNGQTQTRVYIPSFLKSAFQFDNNMLEDENFCQTFDANTEIRVGILANAIVTLQFYIDASVDQSVGLRQLNQGRNRGGRYIGGAM